VLGHVLSHRSDNLRYVCFIIFIYVVDFLTLVRDVYVVDFLLTKLVDLCNSHNNGYGPSTLPLVILCPFNVTAATLKGHKITFKGKQCSFFRDGKLIATGHRMNHLWYIDCASSDTHDTCAVMKDAHDKGTLVLWHQRLGHVNNRRLNFAVKKQLIVGVDVIDKSQVTSLLFCKACVQGKQTRKPFHGSADVHTTEVLQLVRTNVCCFSWWS